MPFTDYFTFREKWDKIIPLDRVAEFQHDMDQLLAEKDQQILDLEDKYEGAKLQKDSTAMIYKQLQQQYTQEIAKRDVLLMELQTELDQVIGEACKFAERLDALDKTSSVHWNDVREFLESPILQSWRARQQS